MAAEVPLPSTSPRPPIFGAPVLASGFGPVRTRPGRPASVSSASVSPASCRPASVSHARSRAHQTPFCARGLLKIIAVSENAPGAHGIVPRHCSTALFHARGGYEHRLRRETSTAKPLPRSSPYGTVPAATRKGKFSRSRPRREPSPQPPPPRGLHRETPATRPPATQPPQSSLYLDAKSSRARPASSTARSTALSLM